MAPKQQPKKSLSSDDAAEEREALALRVIDLLTDQQVLSALKKALFPVELSGRIDALTATLERLSRVVEEKDARITSLEKEVHELADANDSLEQYTRLPNLRFEWIPEAEHGEDTDEKVLDIANGKLGMTPPLQLHDLKRSHRPGRRVDMDGRPRTPSCGFVASDCATTSSAHARGLRRTTGNGKTSQTLVRRPCLEAVQEDFRLLDGLREGNGERPRQ